MIFEDWNGSLNFLFDDPSMKVHYLSVCLTSAVAFYSIEEKDILQEVVDEALACKTCLTDIVKFESRYLDKDLYIISNKLTIALKARISVILSHFSILHRVFVFFCFFFFSFISGFNIFLSLSQFVIVIFQSLEMALTTIKWHMV